MILQNVVFLLLLLPMAIQCEYVANPGDFFLKKTVIPPYRTAVTLLNNDILDKLMKIQLIHGHRQLSTLTHELYCTTQQICNNLIQATSANNVLKDEIDLKTVELAQQISQTESEQRQIRKDLISSYQKIADLQVAIHLAETAVNDKEENYRAGQRDHQQAEIALDDARYCVRRKRRWNWFEETIVEPLNNVGVKIWAAACSVVNHQGIQNAEDRVSVAKNSLDEARNTLTNHQNQHQVAINDRANVQSQLSNINQRLVKQNQQLEQQRAEQTVTTKLATRFKGIKVHLDAISTPSTSLLKELNMVIALDAVIIPLNAIYEELFSVHLIEDETLKVSSDKVKETKSKLKWLAKKLPQVISLQDQFPRSCDSKNDDSNTSAAEIEANQTNWSREDYQEASSNDTFLFEWDNTTDIIIPELNSEDTADYETLSFEPKNKTDGIISEVHSDETTDYETLSFERKNTTDEILPESDSYTPTDNGTLPVEWANKTDVIIPESNSDETNGYGVLLPQWNIVADVHRDRRASKNIKTSGLTTFDSSVDISSLRKRFMVDKQYENTLATAPLTVYLLGRLMVQSSLADFSLLTFKQNGSFARIRAPESFRATLAQIANEGWNAFMEAHSTMNKIQLNMQQIPQHIRTIRRLIKANISYKLLSRLLPKSLAHVTRIGEECKTSSAKVSNIFDDVHKLLQEVELATIASRQGHDAERQKIHDEYNNTRIALAEKQKQKKDLDQELADAKALVKDARSALSDALKKIPVGFTAIANEFCYTVIDFIGEVGTLISGKRGSVDSSGVKNGASSDTVSFAVKETVSCVKKLSATLKSAIDELTKKKSISFGKCSLWQGAFEFWSQMNQKIAYNTMKEQANQIFTRGIDVFKQITQSVQTGGDVKEEDKQELIALLSEVKEFQTKQTSATADNPTPVVNSPKERATDSNPKFIVMTVQQEVRSYERIYEERYSAFRKLNNDISDMVGKMIRLDSTEIHFQDIIEVLKQAVELLRRIKENWSDLTIFFRTIAQEIDVSITSILVPLVEQGEEVIPSHALENDRAFLRRGIEKFGQKAVDESHLIFLISKTYVDISTKYLMKKLAGLSRMMYLTTKEARLAELAQLEKDEKGTEGAVRGLIDQRRRVFQEHLTKREKQLEKLAQQYSDSDEDNEKMSDEDNDLLDKNT